MAKLWAYEEAERIADSLPKETNRVLFQAGFGPSGLPHIGTFCEISRPTFVRKAFQKISSIPTALIVFCDDMDGLRKVPVNFPNKSMLEPHLGKPLVNIPDPFECCSSFSAHMENKLKNFLDAYNFDYEIRSAEVEYSRGAFNEGLTRALENADKIRNIIIPTLKEENRETWSPFMPVCENCGKNLTTRVISYQPDKNELEYICDKDISDKLKGCLHRAATGIHDGKVKLGWKADWALRWFAYGVHYEMYGKDLIESFKLSRKIVRVLGGKEPENYFYEMFLDEDGSKISKSVGRGLTIDTWMDYAPREALSYFVFQQPRKAKRFHFDIIPRIVDEYLDRLKSYYHEDESAKADNPVAFIHENLDERKIFDSEISYSLINNLVSALGVEDIDLIMDYIYGYDPNAKDYANFIRKLAELSFAYFRDNILPNKNYKTPSSDEKKLLNILVEKLSAVGENDAGIYQTEVFNTAKENDVPPKDFFLLIYETVFGQTSGPKVGSFVKLIGKDEFIKKLKAIIE